MYDHFSYGPDQAPGRLTPAHKVLENQQPGHGADRGPLSPKELKIKVEGSIDYLKHRRSLIRECPDPEDRVWLHEIDAMISALRKRLAKLDSLIAKINDYNYDYDVTSFRTQSKPYPDPAARSSDEERLYREDGFQPRNLRPASLERRNMDRRSLPGRPSGRDKHVRQRLNASLAERGLQIVPEDDAGPHEFVDETEELGWGPPPPQPSPEWFRESYRRRSTDSEGADKITFASTRATPGESDDITSRKMNKKGKSDVTVDDPIQRDEKRVVFNDRQWPSHYTGYDENDYGREGDNQEMVYQPKENTEKLMRGGMREWHVHSTKAKTVDLTRPTYIMVHRKYLSPDTLDAYDLPWEWKKVSPTHRPVRCLADKILPG